LSDRRSKFQSILYKYKPGSEVSDPIDVDALAELLKGHPRYLEKVGAGIDHFEVRQLWKYPGFWIVRVDGSETDFSYLKCLNPPASPRTNLSDALRWVVRGDIMLQRSFLKDDDGLIPCAVTGKRLKPGDGHMDHFPKTFESIVRDFLETNSLQIDEIQIKPSEDGRIGSKLANTELAREFRAYHNQAATFRFVCPEINLKGSRRARKG
jgi:hypothetical protein